MAFVPEGQHDSSQARSARVAMQRTPSRTDGRGHCQSQRYLSSKLSPRHEQATARRMLMPLQKRQVLLSKSSGPMMFELVLDVTERFLNLRDTNAQCAIPCCQEEFDESKPIFFSYRTRSFVTPIIESVCTPARIRPYPTGRLFGWRCPMHFVPGYDRTVPPGQKPFAH
jgi:hypothetical protein